MAYLRLKANIGDSIDLWVGEDPEAGVTLTFLEIIGKSTVVFERETAEGARVFGVGDVLPCKWFKVCGVNVTLWAKPVSLGRRGKLEVRFKAPKKVKIVRRHRRRRRKKG